jgi:DNA-binding HxlR family transcriptional regulator
MATTTPDTHEPRMCDAALSRAFDVIGKRWNGVILGTLSSGPAGFAELRRAVGGISDSVLSERLTELAATGLVQRTVTDGPPVTVEYSLAESGIAFLPAMRALSAWAKDHLPRN